MKRRYPLLAAVALQAALFLAVWLAGTARFATNDDVAMLFQAAGVCTDPAPTAFLLWTHVGLGWVLKTLYRAAPGWPWYALYLVGVLFAAQTAVLWAVLRRADWRRGCAVYVLYFALLGAQMLLNLQFTTVGCLAAAAGLWLIAGGEALGRRGWTAAVLLVALGGMVRWLSLALALLLLLPLLAVRLWTWPAKRRAAALLALAAALALSAGLRQADRLARERAPGWREFVEFDPLLCRFVDDDVLEGLDEAGLRAALAPAGWSANDYRMLRRYWFLDPEVFSAERLRAILERVPPLKTGLPWRQVARQTRRALGTPWARHALLAAVAGLLLAGAGRRAWLELVVGLATVAVLTVYLIYARKPPPPRVYLPMFAAVAWIGVWPWSASAAGRAGAGWPRRARLAALAAAAVCVLWAARWALASYRWQSRENRRDQAALAAALARLNPQPRQLYAVWGWALPWPYWPPAADARRLEAFRIFPLSSAQRLPGPQRRLREFGIEDLHRALAEREDLFLICDPREEFPLYQRYLRERYGRDVKGETVFTSDIFDVLRVRP